MDVEQINAIALAASRRSFKRTGVSRVMVRPTLDSDGLEALDVKVVLKGDAEREIRGAALLTLARISRDLQRRGEDRFPFVSYATEAELRDGEAAVGSAEL